MSSVCSNSRSRSSRRSRTSRRSKSLSPAKSIKKSIKAQKKRGRPKVKPSPPEGFVKEVKTRGRPKRGETLQKKTTTEVKSKGRPKAGELRNLPPLPNSEFTREQLTEMFKGTKKVPRPGESEERGSDDSYQPPGVKRGKKVPERLEDEQLQVVEQTFEQVRPQATKNYEAARLIMLTPLDFTQASFTSQPLLMLQIRDVELNKLISSSWHFIRNSQLFYNAINHNIPEISGTIKVDSEFQSLSEIEDGDNKEMETKEESEDEVLLDDIETSDSEELENIYRMGEDLLNT